MTALHDAHHKIEKIDEEIIRLLSDRVTLCHDLLEEDSEALGAEYQADVLAQFDAAADEHGWSVVAAMKTCRGILEMCKQAE
jgi:chorismate mutase